ncbi:MAG: NUDIX hydrolase [Arenicellales bacterium]
MSERSWFPHLTVAAIIEQNEKFLCVEEHPRHHNVINQPAGHVEADESITAAVQREVLEETGYAFTPTELVGLYYFKGSNEVTYLRMCFTGSVQTTEHSGPIDPDITQTHWFSWDELKQQNLRSPVVLKSLEDYLAGQRFPMNLINDFNL